MTKKIGFIINPIAGIGGPVGLKGSDGKEIQRIAEKRGAVRCAEGRAETALTKLLRSRNEIKFFCAPGNMGENLLKKNGFDYEVVGEISENTTSEDTERIAKEISLKEVSVLLFAGGDGTARNIYNAVSDTVPVIGIPAGVKIHSGVFAINPAAAGEVADRYIHSSFSCKLAEVIDLDEEKYRCGEITDTLYGYMKVPAIKNGIQNPKVSSHNEEHDIAGICMEMKERIEKSPEGTCFIIGAGSTTFELKRYLEAEGSLLGIDIYQNGKIIIRDATVNELKQITKEYDCRLIITVIGGQGHIFGRGNQQLSPEVIRAVGLENIWVIAAASKIYFLPDQTLLVDTGDEKLNDSLRGYIRVSVGWQETLICSVR